MEIRPTRRRQVPQALKNLAKGAIEYFGTQRHVIIMQFMVEQDCIEEKKMLQLLYFDPPLLRAQLALLLNERFIHKRSKIVQRNHGKQEEITYYFVNYKSLADIVQYKLFRMRQNLQEEANKANRNRSHLFQCTNLGCGRSYSEFKARELFHTDKNQYFCSNCHKEVQEKGMTTDSTSKLIKFQEFTEPLLELVKEASKFYVATEPEPEIDQEVSVVIQSTSKKKKSLKKPRLLTTSRKKPPQRSIQKAASPNRALNLTSHSNGDEQSEDEVAIIIEIEEDDPEPITSQSESISSSSPAPSGSQVKVLDNLGEEFELGLPTHTDVVEFMSSDSDDSD